MAKHKRKSFRFIGTPKGSQIWSLGSAVTIHGQLLKNPYSAHRPLNRVASVESRKRLPC